MQNSRSHLNSFLINGIFIKVEDGRLDDVYRREHSQANVDGIASFWIQDHHDLFPIDNFLEGGGKRGG